MVLHGDTTPKIGLSFYPFTLFLTRDISPFFIASPLFKEKKNIVNYIAKANEGINSSTEKKCAQKNLKSSVSEFFFNATLYGF